MFYRAKGLDWCLAYNETLRTKEAQPLSYPRLAVGLGKLFKVENDKLLSALFIMYLLLDLGETLKIL